jgi:hypothetical protein
MYHLLVKNYASWYCPSSSSSSRCFHGYVHPNFPNFLFSSHPSHDKLPNLTSTKTTHVVSVIQSGPSFRVSMLSAQLLRSIISCCAVRMLLCKSFCDCWCLYCACFVSSILLPLLMYFCKIILSAVLSALMSMLNVSVLAYAVAIAMCMMSL